ncbi:MAG TPA: ketopantoate reductase family protein, partial [Thermomicrobiales bacterium]|nr:ketopantoate reductase family protein [Thermomicrobiales bacterium]
YDTGPAAEALLPALGPRSVVVTPQNGIESAERVGAVVGAERVLIGTATVTAPGVVEQTGEHCGIALAEPAGGVTARLEAVAAALRDAGIEVTVGAEPGPVLWQKFVWLAPTATVASACGSAVGPILATPEGAALYRAAIAETVAVGRAAGVPLPDDAVDATLAMLAAMPEEKPSMLVDYERGRRVELEELTGAVVRLGRALGVPTPTYDTLYAVLKVRALAAAGRPAQGRPAAGPAR